MRKLIPCLLGLFLALQLILCACTQNQLEPAVPSENGTAVGQPDSSDLEPTPSEADGEETTEVKRRTGAYIDWMWLTYLEFRNFKVIVYGEVQNKGPDQVNEDGDVIFHDVYVEVEECFRGGVEKGDTISYIELGGEVDGWIYESNYPKVKVGDSVVLYLFDTSSSEISPYQLVRFTSDVMEMRKSWFPGYTEEEAANEDPRNERSIKFTKEEYLEHLREDISSMDAQSEQPEE